MDVRKYRLLLNNTPTQTVTPTPTPPIPTQAPLIPTQAPLIPTQALPIPPLALITPMQAPPTRPLPFPARTASSNFSRKVAPTGRVHQAQLWQLLRSSAVV
jgi:hypothetical protein